MLYQIEYNEIDLNIYMFAFEEKQKIYFKTKENNAIIAIFTFIGKNIFNKTGSLSLTPFISWLTH